MALRCNAIVASKLAIERNAALPRGPLVLHDAVYRQGEVELRVKRLMLDPDLLPVLMAHDHRAVEIFCYACSDITDGITNARAREVISLYKLSVKKR